MEISIITIDMKKWVSRILAGFQLLKLQLRCYVFSFNSQVKFFNVAMCMKVK